MSPLTSIVALLFLITSPLRGQIYADFDVGEDIGQGFGTLSFTVELDIPLSLFDTAAAPRLVANFIRLAEGNTPWLDESTGQVRKEPFFDGLRFYKLFDDDQVHFGSRDNTGNDGVGFIIQDDFRSGPLANSTFDPDRDLYMDNDGPNSNGCRFFISLPITDPSVQGRYSRIGRLLNISPFAYFPGESGVQNVFSISYGETDSQGLAEHPFTTINSVTIRRIGNLATGFDEDVWSLPSPAPLHIERDGSNYSLQWSDIAGSSAFFYTSYDLQAWTGPTRLFDSPLATTLGKDITDDVLNFPRAFYRGTGTSYPFVPSSQILFPGQALQVLHPFFGQINYFFNPFDPEEPDAPIGGAYSGGGKSGEFLLDAAVIPGPYKQTITLSHEDDELPRFYIELHYDLDHSVDFESGVSTLSFPARLAGGELEAITEPIPGDLLVNPFSGFWQIVPSP